MEKVNAAFVPAAKLVQVAASMQLAALTQLPANAQLPPTPFHGYTKFVDPSEHAFEVEVPAGWKAEGGLSRASAIDVRPWVRVASPDGLIQAFIGDGEINPGTIPTQTLMKTGFGIGRKYGTSMVMNYIPARKFVEKYAYMKLQPNTSGLKIVDEANHPDLASTINGTGPANASECASIKLTCSVHNIPAVGYYLAATKESLQANSGMWWVTYIAGELCPADREKNGLGVLTHMIQTFHLDPNWQKQSLQTTAAVSANYAASAAAMSRSITERYWSQQAFNDKMNQSYWDRQAVQDHAAENYSDMMRGQQTVQDPMTNTRYKVQSGSSQYYIDPSGRISGTEGGAPGSAWRPLNKVP